MNITKYIFTILFALIAIYLVHSSIGESIKNLNDKTAIQIRGNR